MVSVVTHYWTIWRYTLKQGTHLLKPGGGWRNKHSCKSLISEGRETPNRQYRVSRISPSMLIKPRQFSLENLVMQENYFVLTNKQNKDVSPTANAWESDFKNLIYSYPGGTRSWCGLHVHKKAVAYAMEHSGEKVTAVCWGEQFSTPCEPSNPLHVDSYLHDKKKRLG